MVVPYEGSCSSLNTLTCVCVAFELLSLWQLFQWLTHRAVSRTRANVAWFRAGVLLNVDCPEASTPAVGWADGKAGQTEKTRMLTIMGHSPRNRRAWPPTPYRWSFCQPCHKHEYDAWYTVHSMWLLLMPYGAKRPFLSSRLEHQRWC